MFKTFLETAKADFFARGGVVTKCPTRTCYGGESKQRNLRRFLREEVTASLPVAEQQLAA